MDVLFAAAVINSVHEPNQSDRPPVGHCRCSPELQHERHRTHAKDAVARPQIAFIVITAHGTVETAVDAMRAGAFDFIAKPLDLNLVRQQVRKALDHYQLQRENRQLRGQLADVGEISNIIGNCAAMQDVFHQIRQVASTDATVMIHGESGTGKELIARGLHNLSDRSSGPFLAVNPGALPETLLESELVRP